MRTGIGYDCHRLVPGRRLVLGGVELEHDRGLQGHSDADVLTHAIIDAMLGACALGDIGQHFPFRYTQDVITQVVHGQLVAGTGLARVDPSVPSAGLSVLAIAIYGAILLAATLVVVRMRDVTS